MANRILLTVVVIFSSGHLLSQDVNTQTKNDFFTEVDKSAEFPGGLQSFYQFLTKNLIYPPAARRNAVEGTTFIEFIVDKAGYIIPNSVKTIQSLHPACDEEAIRVIKSCKVKWQHALMDGKAVNQKFVLPVGFKPTSENIEIVRPLNPIKNPITTIVVEKQVQSVDPESWTVYSDYALTTKYGRIARGDSVEVNGWAAWAYFIRTNDMNGYVSWKSLSVVPELDSLSKIIASRSNMEDEKQRKILDSIYQDQRSNAFLSVSASKKTIYVGECATLTMDFNVSDKNRVRMQFYDLGIQLAEILTTGLAPDNCWILNSRIDDIIGESKKIGDSNYTTYTIYKGSYCPVTDGTLDIPANKLRIAKMKIHSMEVDTMLTFISKPISIKVNPLPSGLIPSSSDGFKMVGKFTLSDTILSNKVAAGAAVTYSLTIRGEGLTFPIEPPKIEMENVMSQLQSTIDSDTLLNGQLRSSKTFLYTLVFKKPGVYDFRKKIQFTYFNPDSKNLATIKASSVVTVSNAGIAKPSEFSKVSRTKVNFIAIDASQSMKIEDYLPYRLKAATTGIKGFLSNRKACDIGLIIFGGDAKLFNISKPDSCYSSELVNSIGFGLNTNGTAIGDAIWLAKNSFAETNLPKKLVIIGDGDNTAGHITPKFAAELIKAHNIKIYAIGIGKQGLVPFGRDPAGDPLMIDNTFTDKALKAISSITNGQYYWAKDTDDLVRILKLIFQ